MAIRKIAQTPTPEDRARADRVKRARQVRTPIERSGHYYEQIAELAGDYGLDVSDLVDEWSERAAAREYLGGYTKEAAEFLAMGDLRERVQR